MSLRRYLSTLAISLLCFSQVAQSNTLESLTFYTEEYPPFNYCEEGEIKGIAVDMLEAASRKVGQPVTRDMVKLRPWPRAYRATKLDPNTVLFAMVRTSMREESFLWAGPIYKVRVVLLAKKSRNIRISGPEDLARYTVGVILDDVGEQLALEAGAELANLERTNTADALARMLEYDRIDLWAYQETTAHWSMAHVGINEDDYEAVYVLNEADLYYAFHRDTNPRLPETLQKGLDLIKVPDPETGESEYQRILRKYELEPFSQ